MRNHKPFLAAVGLSVAALATVGAAGSASAAGCQGGYPAAQCSASVSATVISAGHTMTFSGSGFSAGETVKASVNGMVVGTYTANASGFVSGSYVVPANFKPGRYTMTLTGATSGRVLKVSFTVVPAVANAGVVGNGGSLAYTGAEVGGLATGGAVLIVGGAAALVAARRRRAGNAA